MVFVFLNLWSKSANLCFMYFGVHCRRKLSLICPPILCQVENPLPNSWSGSLSLLNWISDHSFTSPHQSRVSSHICPILFALHMCRLQRLLLGWMKQWNTEFKHKWNLTKSMTVYISINYICLNTENCSVRYNCWTEFHCRWWKFEFIVKRFEYQNLRGGLDPGG